MLGNTAESLDIGDLPIVPGDMRATALFAAMRTTLRTVRLRVGTWRPQPGAGWELIYRLLRLNARAFALQMALASSGALVYYAPPFFLRELVAYLESDPERGRRAWGWFYAICLFASTAGVHLRESPSLLRVGVCVAVLIGGWADGWADGRMGSYGPAVVDLDDDDPGAA